MGKGKKNRKGWPEERWRRSREKAQQSEFPERWTKRRPQIILARYQRAFRLEVERRAQFDSGRCEPTFYFNQVRFFRAALAPFLPRAVRVFLGRCAIVLFRRAAFAAFLMFRFAAARCFLVVILFGN